MTIKKHKCFGTKTDQLGDSLDCPKCWAALEYTVDLSFPGAPEPYEAEPFPHLVVDKDPRTVDLNETSPEVLPSSLDPRTCAYCGRQDRACTFCQHRPPVDEDGHA